MDPFDLLKDTMDKHTAKIDDLVKTVVEHGVHIRIMWAVMVFFGLVAGRHIITEILKHFLTAG